MASSAQQKQFIENPRYYICEDGNVWDSKRNRFLPQCNRNKLGYKCVTLNMDGKYKLMSVHRLVAQAFIPNPNNYPEVNHKDENPENNTASNLEWCDRTYNNNYGTRNLRSGLSQANREDVSKPVVQYDRSGNYIAEYPSAQEAHRKTNSKRKIIRRVALPDNLC